MYGCMLSHVEVWWLLHAFLASERVCVCVCVTVCVHERERRRRVQVVTHGKEYVNFALESGQKPWSFSIFLL